MVSKMEVQHGKKLSIALVPVGASKIRMDVNQRIKIEIYFLSSRNTNNTRPLS